MGKVIIHSRSCEDPITWIGEAAGICWGADTSDPVKNYKRGVDCIQNQHGRTWEFPDVFFVLDDYSARVIREFYTHIGGAPTRLQESTRYVDYSDFDYVTPHSIEKDPYAKTLWDRMMENTAGTLKLLEEEYDIPREDTGMGLPLGMETRVIVKMNMRTLIDMSHQRLCTRAYWEYRELMRDLMKALSDYSEEWATVVRNLFVPKCEFLNGCPERHCCGRRPQLERKPFN